MSSQVRKKIKVFVGVSGGVDSSVALALLQEEGYDVTGVFLKVWHPDFSPSTGSGQSQPSCDWKEERRSAMRVCAHLGVPFLTLDCEKEYKKEVVDYMIAEYRAGRTPNPDVFCNKFVKFGVFLKKAIEMGADFIATGHYARVETREFPISNFQFPKKNKIQYKLLESVDKNKDQSYFLYTLNQDQLSHTLFPVGHLTKPQVRKLAKKFGLPTAEKKDSQGLCFIGKVDMKEFLSHFIKTKPGNVLNTKGDIVGKHDGAVLYTIGERHGFIITKKSPNDPRYFVVSKDLENDTITVADKENQKEEIFSIKEIVVTDLHLISDFQDLTSKIKCKGCKGLPFATTKGSPLQCQIRIRYRQEKQNCLVSKKSDGYHIVFDKPQNGTAPGQSAVLYDGNVCLGGGVIEKVF